jgi:hypothetical protein
MELRRAEGVEAKGGPGEERQPEGHERIESVFHSPPLPIKQKNEEKRQEDGAFLGQQGGQVENGGDNQARESFLSQKIQKIKKGQSGQEKREEVGAAGDPGDVLEMSGKGGKEERA